ncbi:MAG: response regulator [Rhizomicrobium sp.]
MTGTIHTVLLIEDEPLIRMGTCAMLEDGGYKVMEAANADEAKMLLAEHSEISIVITDVQMPGSMDGLALARLVIQNYVHIPVLITSGRADPRDARLDGAATYIPKPYTAQMIERALHQMRATG